MNTEKISSNPQSNNDKKNWETPEIIILNQNKTEGGSYPAMSEDFGGSVGTS